MFGIDFVLPNGQLASKVRLQLKSIYLERIVSNLMVFDFNGLTYF